MPSALVRQIAAQIYDLAGEPLTDAARAAIVDNLEHHRQNRLGRIAFGFDEHDLPGRFNRYGQRFSVSPRP